MRKIYKKYPIFEYPYICFGLCHKQENFPEIETPGVKEGIYHIMRELEYISATYTKDCVNVARESINYRESRDLAVNSSSFAASSAGYTICDYKTFIVTFIYLYLKDNPHWFFPSPDIYKYANNLNYYLRFLKFSIHELPREVPETSCICYCMEVLEDKILSFQHAFLMISYENYFIIYDAWAKLRTKWVRAMLKTHVIEVLNQFQDLTIPYHTNRQNIQYEEYLLNYFFDVTEKDGFRTRIGSLQLYFLPLDDERFQKAYHDSIHNDFMLEKSQRNTRKKGGVRKYSKHKLLKPRIVRKNKRLFVS
jgi:hypothetical protein